MTKYIKLDRVKLMKGIMDALVLEEEPRYGDLYLEIIAPDNEIFSSVEQFIKRSVCFIDDGLALQICCQFAVYYKLIKEKGKI